MPSDFQGKLLVTEWDAYPGPNLPIDAFFSPAGEMASALLKFIRHPLHKQPVRSHPQTVTNTIQKIEELTRAQRHRTARS